jgi:uncharacterized membrane protein YwzB
LGTFTFVFLLVYVSVVCGVYFSNFFLQNKTWSQKEKRIGRFSTAIRYCGWSSKTFVKNKFIKQNKTTTELDFVVVFVLLLIVMGAKSETFTQPSFI